MPKNSAAYADACAENGKVWWGMCGGSGYGGGSVMVVVVWVVWW